jgi:uncharacterized membrane protein (DUF373 family)
VQGREPAAAQFGSGPARLSAAFPPTPTGEGEAMSFTLSGQLTSRALERGATRWFNRIVDLIVRLLMPLVIVALMMGIARVVLDLGAVYRSASIAAGFDLLVTDILSMFVVVELLRSIVEYFEIHRIRITFILDAAVVFVVREVMIGLYRHSMPAAEIAAMAALLLVLGGFRIAAVRFSPAQEEEAPARPEPLGRIRKEAA